MIRRLFPSDKNYILNEVQASQKDSLLNELVKFVKKVFRRQPRTGYKATCYTTAKLLNINPFIRH